MLASLASAPPAKAAQSTINLKQLNNNQVEAVISGLKYPLAGVVHVLTDHPTCDSGAIRGSHLPELEDRLDFHELMSKQYERNTDSDYTYYQGQPGDWSDKNRQFKFLFPVVGGNQYRYVRDRNTQVAYPPGKYLCLQVAYHDNNQFLNDYGQITLLTLTDPVFEDGSYKFRASRNVHWSTKKASHIFDFATCEADVAASGSASSSFTFRATESNRYSHFCVIARDSSGLQAYKLFMVNPPEKEPDPAPTEPDPPKPQNFRLRLNQTKNANKITVTARVAGNSGLTTGQWRYLVADSSRVSLTTANDCQRLFDNPPAGQVLVKPRSMTQQTGSNTASASVPASRAGQWFCVRAQEQNGGVGFGYLKLPEPETTTSPTTTTTTTPDPTNTDNQPETTSTAPTPEPPDQTQPEPDQPQPEPIPAGQSAEAPADQPDEEPDSLETPPAAADQQPADSRPAEQTKPEADNPWFLAVSVATGVGLSLTIWLLISRRQPGQKAKPNQPPDG